MHVPATKSRVLQRMDPISLSRSVLILCEDSFANLPRFSTEIDPIPSILRRGSLNHLYALLCAFPFFFLFRASGLVSLLSLRLIGYVPFRPWIRSRDLLRMRSTSIHTRKQHDVCTDNTRHASARNWCATSKHEDDRDADAIAWKRHTWKGLRLARPTGEQGHASDALGIRGRPTLQLDHGHDGAQRDPSHTCHSCGGGGHRCKAAGR